MPPGNAMLLSTVCVVGGHEEPIDQAHCTRRPRDSGSFVQNDVRHKLPCSTSQSHWNAGKNQVTPKVGEVWRRHVHPPTTREAASWVVRNCCGACRLMRAFQVRQFALTRYSCVTSRKISGHWPSSRACSSTRCPLRKAARPRGSPENQNHCVSVPPLRKMNCQNWSEQTEAKTNKANMPARPARL